MKQEWEKDCPRMTFTTPTLIPVLTLGDMVGIVISASSRQNEHTSEVDTMKSRRTVTNVAMGGKWPNNAPIAGLDSRLGVSCLCINMQYLMLLIHSPWFSVLQCITLDI